MNKNISLTVKVVITGILGALGIMYIMAKPPVSEVRSYQKQEMAKPFSFGSSRSSKVYKSDASSSAADSDAVSLMGKTGRYSEHTIGKPMPQPKKKEK
jgi:hypothetical protein